MTTSGWCSGHDGCTSARAHATCGDRIAQGLLVGCGCGAWGGHESPAVERDSALNPVDSGVTKRPLGGASTPLIQGASPTNEESTSA